MDNVIYVLVGLPGSGKSTYRYNLKFEYHPDDMVELSSDDYIEYVANGLGMTYNEVFRDFVSIADQHIWQMFHTAINNSKPVIVWDQTNLTLRKRKDILDKVPASYKKIAVYVSTSVEESIRRNESRGRTIPNSVITKMAENVVVPSVEEGFDEVILI